MRVLGPFCVVGSGIGVGGGFIAQGSDRQIVDDEIECVIGLGGNGFALDFVCQLIGLQGGSVTGCQSRSKVDVRLEAEPMLDVDASVVTDADDQIPGCVLLVLEAADLIARPIEVDQDIVLGHGIVIEVPIIAFEALVWVCDPGELELAAWL